MAKRDGVHLIDLMAVHTNDSECQLRIDNGGYVFSSIEDDCRMTSWRDSASESAQGDLDGLLGPALDFAKQQLSAHGQFYPFAVAIRATGEQEMISVNLPELALETSAVNSALVATLMEQRDRMRAVAIVTDRRAADRPSDVVTVIMEHTEGACLAVELPYTRRRTFRRFKFGALRASAALPSIW